MAQFKKTHIWLFQIELSNHSTVNTDTDRRGKLQRMQRVLQEQKVLGTPLKCKSILQISRTKSLQMPQSTFQTIKCKTVS